MAQSGEHVFQKSAYEYLKRALPPHAHVWSVDNEVQNDGSARAKMILIKRRERGILPGTPDLHALVNGMYAAFEVKNPNGGRLSYDQLDWRRAHILNGGFWFGPVRTLEEIEASLICIGLVPRARLGGMPVAVPRPGKLQLANWARARRQQE